MPVQCAPPNQHNSPPSYRRRRPQAVPALPLTIKDNVQETGTASKWRAGFSHLCLWMERRLQPAGFPFPKWSAQSSVRIFGQEYRQTRPPLPTVPAHSGDFTRPPPARMIDALLKAPLRPLFRHEHNASPATAGSAASGCNPPWWNCARCTSTRSHVEMPPVPRQRVRKHRVSGAWNAISSHQHPHLGRLRDCGHVICRDLGTSRRGHDSALVGSVWH